jgi:hypothetical protein
MAFLAGVVFALLKPLELRFRYGDVLRWVLAFTLTASGLLAVDLVAGKLNLVLYLGFVLLMALCGLAWAAFMRGIKP